MPSKKIYTNTLAQIWGKVMTAIISIFLIKILTNYLDVAGYGLYTKIYNFISIFAVIADLGLYAISVREISKHSENPVLVEKMSANILTLRTISGLIIIGLSLSIAPFLSGYESSLALVWIFIAWLFTLLGLANSSLMSYLQATLRTEFSFVANTASRMLTFGLIFMFASVLFPISSWISLGSRYILVMIAGLIGNLLMFALTYWYASKYIRIYFGWDTAYIKEILLLSLPYWLALFLSAIFFKVDTILLSLMETKEKADIAIALYALPMKIVEVGMMYGTVFLNSFLGVLSKTEEEWRHEDSKNLTYKAFQVLFACGLSLSIFLWSFGKEVLMLISWEKFLKTHIGAYGSVDAMSIVSFIFLFYFVSSLFTYILIARNEQKKLIYINGGVALFNIIWNLIVIPYFSFIGSAWVTLLSQILLIIITYFYIRKSIKGAEFVVFSSWMVIAGYASLCISNYFSWFFIFEGTFFFLIFVSLFFFVPYIFIWWCIRKYLI